MKSSKKVLLGMSGGIDSSVCAYLLKKEGYEVIGVTMLLWDEKNNLKPRYNGDACFSPNEKNDLNKAKKIAEKIGIEHVSVNLADAYKAAVLDNFKNEYLNAKTPNPCIICNEKIKFQAMLEAVKSMGIDFDCFATGHYARIVEKNGRYALARAADLTKDQSYFLYRLKQEQLRMLIFPLAQYTKSEIRKIDVQLGLHGAEQKESMDFYSGDYSDLLDIEARDGNIVDKDNNIIGKHKGYWNYTIGQRRGLGVSSSKPLYVIDIDSEKNEVKLGDINDTLSYKIEAFDLSFMATCSDFENLKAYAKVRSSSKPVECIASAKGGILCVEFPNGVFSPAKGQSVVLYDSDGVVLLGGIISKIYSEKL